MRDERKEVKTERSIPVTTRLDCTTLASLEAFFTSQGYAVRSMSNLINLSIEALAEALHEKGMLHIYFDSIPESLSHLQQRGIWQQGVMKRNFGKISNAIGFENLRKEGIDPYEENPAMFDKMHNQPRTTDLDQSIQTTHKKNYDSTPREKTEKELDELAKAQYRKNAEQRELYKKMKFPVNEDVEEEKDNE